MSWFLKRRERGTAVIAILTPSVVINQEGLSRVGSSRIHMRISSIDHSGRNRGAK